MEMCPRRAEAPHLAARFPGPDIAGDSCSYCGSLTGAAFMERVRAGDEVGPTDKSYKAYLDNPWAKVYFQHLDEEQRREFVEVLNARRVAIGYPGHFYVLPYFVRLEAPANETAPG